MFLGLGLTSLFGAATWQRGIDSFTHVGRPVSPSIPWVGDILFNHDPLVYLSFLAGTGRRGGCCIAAAGACCCAAPANARGARRPTATRRSWSSTSPSIGGGMLAGIGGAQLSMAYANAWFENMTQGRGFIAVAGDLRRLAARSRSAAAPTSSAPRWRCRPALQARGLRRSTSSPSTPCRTSSTLARARPARHASGPPRRPKGSRRSSSAAIARPRIVPTATHPATLEGGTPMNTAPVHARSARSSCRCSASPLRRRRSNDGDDDRGSRPAAARRQRPPAPGPGARRSASSSSAPRTTSATTRPPTRAARR